MAEFEQHEAAAETRLSGEDAPTWLPVSFAAIGVLVAGAAAWLALNSRTAPPQQAGGEAAHVLASSAPAREAPSAPSAATKLPSAPTSEPMPGALADARTAMSPADIGQAATPSTQPTTEQENCPLPVHVPFKMESAAPNARDEEVQMALGQLQAFMNRHAEALLSVEGHADSVGPENYNLLLSYRRAKAVVALLSKSGLSEKRMVVRAAGDNAPIDGLPSDSGKNRRVVLQVVGTASCQEGSSGRLQ